MDIFVSNFMVLSSVINPFTCFNPLILELKNPVRHACWTNIVIMSSLNLDSWTESFWKLEKSLIWLLRSADSLVAFIVPPTAPFPNFNSKITISIFDLLKFSVVQALKAIWRLPNQILRFYLQLLHRTLDQLRKNQYHLLPDYSCWPSQFLDEFAPPDVCYPVC